MTATVDPAPAIEHEDDLIVIDRAMEPLYRECYEALGWELISTVSPADRSSLLCGFRRVRPVLHRLELELLQHECDRTLDTIAQLRRLRDTEPDRAAIELATGLVGVVCAVSALAFAAVGLVTASLWIPVAVVGIAACVLVGRRVQRRICAVWRLEEHLELLRAFAKKAAALRS